MLLRPARVAAFQGLRGGARTKCLCEARGVNQPDRPSIDEQIEHAVQRQHILAPILRALDKPHRVLDLLHNAADPEAGRSALISEFALDEIQATAVMDAQFRHLTRADRDRLRSDLKQVEAQLQQLHARRGNSQ